MLAVMILLPPHTLKLLSTLSAQRIYESPSESESTHCEGQVQAVRNQNQGELDDVLHKTCTSQTYCDQRLTSVVRENFVS